MPAESISTFSCPWHNPEYLNRVETATQFGRAVFESTGLKNEKSIGEEDVWTVQLFMELVAHEEALKKHSNLAGNIAFEITNIVNEHTGTNLNPYAHQVALHLHDLGHVGTHAFGETDEVTGILWRSIGIRNDLQTLTHNTSLYMSDQDIDFENLPIETRISVLADVFAKPSSYQPNRIRHKEEIFTEVKMGKQKYLKKNILSRYEKELLERFDEYTQKEAYVISNCVAWIESMGVNLNDILDRVWEQQ